MNHDSKLSRREWLKQIGRTGLTLSAFSLFGERLFAAIQDTDLRPVYGAEEMKIFNSRFDAKGLPTTVLGRTGVVVPRMGLGLGSRFCAFAAKDHDGSIDMLNYALDNGFYYWDTAPIYSGRKDANSPEVFSEDIAGEVVKYRRNEIFLNSKVCTRNGNEVLKSVETTLRKLNTDHLDMMMVHGVENMEDFQRIRKNRIIEQMQELREQKVFKFFGFSGHGEADALKAMADLGLFDVVLMAMDPYRVSKSGSREKIMIATANKYDMGIMLMKSVRPHEGEPGVNMDDMIRLSLNTPGITGTMVGMDSIDIVKRNLHIMRTL